MQGTQIIVTHAAVTGDDVPEAGLRTRTKVYLAWDSRAGRVFVVQWDRVAWRCSCHKAQGCAHKIAVNDYALALGQAQRSTTDDLTAHSEDERGAGR